MTGIEVRLEEWSAMEPEPGAPLAGLSISRGARPLADDLTSSHRLEVLELAQGLKLETTSWVGRIVLDNLTVTIQPKISGMPLLGLLRYAYRLRQLDIFSPAGYGHAPETFQDLILFQLAEEATELISRGLHLEYERTGEELASPRGRLDFQRYLRRAGAGSVTLPCEYYPRTRSTILNLVMLAGLQRGAAIASEVGLRVRLRSLSRRLEIDLPAIDLDRDKMRQAQTALDRRTETYRPVLTLIELLLESQGVSLDEPRESVQLPGFLFDMNRFFQALLSRFLREHLTGHVVEDEFRLKGICAYHPSHNPRRRRSPTPRPDFVVTRGARMVAVLDAKYRDLWERSLPENMLYQLAVYALMTPVSMRQSIILYPTLSSEAIDQVIVFRGPVRGDEEAQVVLRPVNLLQLEQLLNAGDGLQVRRNRRELAHKFVFGAQSP